MHLPRRCKAGAQAEYAMAKSITYLTLQRTGALTCQVLGDPEAGAAGRRVRLRRGGHLEELQQHGVRARHHIARQLAPLAPGAGRACLPWARMQGQGWTSIPSLSDVSST